MERTPIGLFPVKQFRLKYNDKIFVKCKHFRHINHLFSANRPTSITVALKNWNITQKVTTHCCRDFHQIVAHYNINLYARHVAIEIKDEIFWSNRCLSQTVHINFCHSRCSTLQTQLFSVVYRVLLRSNCGLERQNVVGVTYVRWVTHVVVSARCLPAIAQAR